MASKPQKDLYQFVGSKIRQRREKKRLTQEFLGQQVGLSRTSVTNVEQGRQAILVHQLVEFARALHVEPSALLPSVKPKRQPRIPPEIAHLVKRLTGSVSSQKD
jgi:transcriptional regulator with XRE-family HTH domain